MAGHDHTSGWTGGNIYETSLLALESVVRATAPRKNVAITDEAADYIAERAADAIELSDHYQLLREDQAACRRAADAIHRAIDEHYFLQVGVHVAGLFGVAEAATSFAPIFMQSAMHALHGERGIAAAHEWPDPKQFAAELLASQPYATLFWKHPEGGVASLAMRFWTASGESQPSSASLASEVHRPGADGPAVQHIDAAGSPVLEIYMEHGKRHRDPAAGPAFFKIDEIDGETRQLFEYWQDGELHHSSSEGPAALEINMEGLVRLEFYLEHGKRHRDAADGPAFFKVARDADQLRLEYAYFWEGALHRDPSHGPALIERDAATGAILRQEFHRHGLLHRDEHDGPAVLERYELSAPFPSYEAYYHNGELHRGRGPAMITRCPDTGAVIGEWHYIDGRLHRDGGPAIVSRHPDGTIYYEAWYRDDALLEERGDPCAGVRDDADAASPHG